MSLVYTFKRFWSFLRLDELVSAALSGDDDWDYSEEPHTSRRSEILRKHPEIKRLMGYDPFIAYVLAFEVSLQLFMAWCVRDSPWWLVVLLAYCVGAFVNHSCGTAIHEIGHNLAFGHSRPILNRLLGMFANLPLAVPFSVTYKKYHSDHH
ncbi:putative sphingolipid delta(4)-desaturase/C4-monooxygenase, partial [Lingula anatina]